MSVAVVEKRACMGCGATLRSGNKGDYCSPCDESRATLRLDAADAVDRALAYMHQVVLTNGGDAHSAATATVEWVLTEGLVDDIFRAQGSFFLAKLYGQRSYLDRQMKGGRAEQFPPVTMLPVVPRTRGDAPPSGVAEVATQGMPFSRYRPELIPFEYAIQFAVRGKRKLLGDMTREDCLLVALDREQLASTHKRTATAMRTLAERLEEDGVTIRQRWTPEELREALQRNDE